MKHFYNATVLACAFMLFAGACRPADAKTPIWGNTSNAAELDRHLGDYCWSDCTW